MSIEQTLERIAKSLETIARTMEHTEEHHPAPTVPTVPEPVAVVPVPAPAPAVPEPAPVPVPAVPVPPVPAVPAAAAAPFTDSKGLMAYCMEKYKVLGPAKGGMIQQILLEMGVNNLTALTPAQYGTFYEKVEAL